MTTKTVVGPPNSLANDDPDRHCRLPRRPRPNVVDGTIDMKTLDRDPLATILATSTSIKVEIRHHDSRATILATSTSIKVEIRHHDSRATTLATSTSIKVEILHHMPQLLPEDNSYPLDDQRGTTIEAT
jgi:hypothetical protein